MPIPTSAQTLDLPGGFQLAADVSTDNVIIYLSLRKNDRTVPIAEVTIDKDSATTHTSVSLEGLNLNLYRSTIDAALVLDVLTANDGIVEHNQSEEPCLRITVNDGTVYSVAPIPGDLPREDAVKPGNERPSQ